MTLPDGYPNTARAPDERTKEDSEAKGIENLTRALSHMLKCKQQRRQEDREKLRGGGMSRKEVREIACVFQPIVDAVSA